MKFPLHNPTYYYSLFREIVGFIKRPHNKPNLEKSTTQKVYDTIGLFILKMFLLIPVILFFAIVYDPENVQSVSMAKRFSPITFLLIGGFILPLVEEIAFRLSLVFNRNYISLSVSALSYYLLTKAIFQTKISAVDESFVLRVSIALIIGIIIFLLLNIKTLKERVNKFWSTHFRSIYYISCLIFAWMHISKYEPTWTNILLLPILTLPQLLSALIYGYIRVSFGFKYPLILHSSMNTIAIGLSLGFA